MGNDSPYTRYANVSSRTLADLEFNVNQLVAKGCVPTGGLVVLHEDGRPVYVQSLFVPDPTNNCLGVMQTEQYPEVMEELRKGNKLVGVAKLQKITGWSMLECKEWCDKQAASLS